MHWCLGTYASASTWVYNVTLKTAAALYPDHTISGRFGSNFVELGFLGEPGTSRLVIKTHDVDQAAEEVLERLAEAILVSVRDPRDCVASLLTYQRLPFDEALGKVARSAATCAGFLDHPRATLLRFEDGFPDDPSTIDRIAHSFGASVGPADRDRIFHETRRGAIERFIATFDALPTVHHHADPLETLDLTTQWHRHHAGRTGEIGRWRHELTGQSLRDAERTLGTLIERLGYV